jgi:hypothetical protein
MSGPLVNGLPDPLTHSESWALCICKLSAIPVVGKHQYHITLHGSYVISVVHTSGAAFAICRGDRYMLAYHPSVPRWPLAGGRKGGRLLLALRDDAGAEDITAAIVQAAQTRAALAPPASGVAGGRPPSGVAAQRKALQTLRHMNVAPEVVQHALAKSHGAARGDAGRLVAAMREGRWQVWPFMLSSVERAGYIALSDKS